MFAERVLLLVSYDLSDQYLNNPYAVQNLSLSQNGSGHDRDLDNDVDHEEVLVLDLENGHYKIAWPGSRIGQNPEVAHSKLFQHSFVVSGSLLRPRADQRDSLPHDSAVSTRRIS